MNAKNGRIQSLERQLKEKQDKNLHNSKSKAQARKNEVTETPIEINPGGLEQLTKIAEMEEKLRKMDVEMQEKITVMKMLDVEIQEKLIKLTAKERLLQQVDLKINQREDLLEQKEDLLKGKTELLLVKNESLKTKDDQLKETMVQLAEKENQLVELKRVLSEKQAQVEFENQAEATSQNENQKVRCTVVKHYILGELQCVDVIGKHWQASSRFLPACCTWNMY